MWKRVRITFLVLVLSFVSTKTYLQQLDATDWIETLRVVIYPVAGDQSMATRQYIQALTVDDFRSIEAFMQGQADSYGLRGGKPVEVALAPLVENRPPVATDVSGVLDSVIFSLRFRFWAFRHDRPQAPGDIRVFVVYNNPEETDHLPNSLALRKGLLGLVYAFASPEYAGSNNFVITHEMLHTLGASDKYDPATNMPIHPAGFAEPFIATRYPQRKAEIMGGRIPFNKEYAYMPYSLDDAMIGGFTASEIKWIR